MVQTTPTSMNDDVLEFCKEIDLTTTPVFVNVTPTKNSIPGECYGNVENHITENGGGVEYDWIIWEDPGVYIEAEFHAVWVNDTGEYVDVTPKLDGERSILFLKDSKIKFIGKLIDNIRKPLIDNAETRTMIAVEKKKFEIKNKYYNGNPAIKIPELEIKALESLKKKVFFSEIKKDMLDGKIRIGRNKPCLCGSGKKHKICCMPK